MEEAYDDCKPKNSYHEFVKFYIYYIVCQRLTPLVSRAYHNEDETV